MRCVISDGALKGGMHEITQSRMWMWWTNAYIWAWSGDRMGRLGIQGRCAAPLVLCSVGGPFSESMGNGNGL